MSFDGYISYHAIMDHMNRSRHTTGFQQPRTDAAPRSAPQPVPTVSNQNAIAPPSKPGKFTQGATAVIDSQTSSKTADGMKATYHRSFNDGSTSVQHKTKTGDGTSMTFIRRSTADAQGMQTIRVRQVHIDTNGQRHVEIKTYTAPAGAAMSATEELPGGFLQRATRFIRHEMPDGSVQRLPVEPEIKNPDPVANNEQQIDNDGVKQ